MTYFDLVNDRREVSQNLMKTLGTLLFKQNKYWNKIISLIILKKIIFSIVLKALKTFFKFL